MNITRKKNDEVKQEQADSSNVVASSEDTKKQLLETSNSDVIDSNEAEAKEIDFNEAQLNKSENIAVLSCHESETAIDCDAGNKDNSKFEKSEEIIIAPIESKNIDNVKIENLENVETDEKIENKENIKDVEEEKDKIVNENIDVKEVIPEAIDDEDNIQDEELDHEVDEEEINSRSNDFNQTNDPVILIINCIYVFITNKSYYLGKISSRK